MKKLIALIALFLAGGMSFAQNTPFKIKLSQPDQYIKIRMDQVSATVTGYDGDEVIIEALPDPNKQVPEEAKGLKLISIPGRGADNQLINPVVKQDGLNLNITIPSGGYRYLSIKVPKTLPYLEVEMYTYLSGGRLIVNGVNLIRVRGIIPFIKINDVSSFDIVSFDDWNDMKPEELRPDLYGAITVIDEGKVIKKAAPGYFGTTTTITDGKVTRMRVGGKDYTRKKDIDSLIKRIPVDVVNVNKTADTVRKIKINGKIYADDDLPVGMMNLPAYITDRAPTPSSIVITNVNWSKQSMFINGKYYDRYCEICANHADIDLSVPDTVKANLVFCSILGQVYSGLDADAVNASDTDIKAFKASFHVQPGIKTIRLNGGDSQFNITMVNNTGNIYLRKQK